MGLFGFLRGKDERAIPEPGTPEFEAAVQGSAIPDSQSVSMGEPGWTDPASETEPASETIDLRGTDVRERITETLAQMMRIPNAGGFGGGISAPKQDPLDQVAHLAKQRDSGQITEAEFEAQKRRLLG